MHPLEAYIRELRDIRATGAAVQETSYYGALANLLNAVGATLRPPVRCVLQLQNRGAGLPDGGLFAADQFEKRATEPLPGQMPARGVIEVKGTGEDAWVVADGPQVTRYWGLYHQVLVTNYRDFVLIGRGPDGAPARLETYRLAESEAAFRAAAAHPRRVAEEHGVRILEYLKRVMLRETTLAAPDEVAWFLASYARDARARLEASDLPALDTLRRALEESLGMTFEGPRGEHFFRSTLVQTLFYGVFSAWVLWSKERAPTDTARFDWRTAAWYLPVPMIQVLFSQVAVPHTLGPLRLVEVLDWAGAVLNRVDRAAFFERFEDAHAVQYFYEPFLQAFDPDLRKELGVWYTPPEVVEYMVARVDTVLRQELGIEDGLADPRVHVLDPCCGTGAYLVAVLDRIAATLHARGWDALRAHELKEAALGRLYGFEILPAPFVIAHLQVGLRLQRLEAPLTTDHHERAAVYLTNALTGWEPPTGPKAQLAFPAFAEERDAANAVKVSAPILVILGNPPYNGYAGVAMKEERALSEAYRTTRRAPAPQGQGLNDLYVRFFRMAERRIAEQTGRGVVCFISNYSWLDGLSFTGMRERYLDAFDRIWIDCLNGDKYKTGKLTPEGKPDPSIFSTELNREGIQVGTAIALLVRKEQSEGTDEVLFRHLWGTAKRADLTESAQQRDDRLYTKQTPAVPLGLSFMPGEVDATYLTWPVLPELFPASFPGVQTSRDDVVIDIDRDRLVERMERYFDPAISDEQLRALVPGAMRSTGRFDAPAVRAQLLQRGFRPESIVRHCYRPFDLRWLYWEPETKLLDEKRADYFPHIFEGNIWLAAAQRHRREFDPPVVSTRSCARHVDERGANLFPLFLRNGGRHTPLFEGHAANLSILAAGYLRDVAAEPPDLFYHTLAVLHAPAYRSENAGALRQDWPRVPLPASRDALLASAALGRRVAALLDPETPVPGVTAGALRPEMPVIARITRVGGGSLDPNQDLSVTAGWGHAGKGGVTMPARGKAVARDYTPEERAALESGAAALGLDPAAALTLLGETTCDISLNDVACWENVPARVWEYTIGGYQVMKKWLSYRERPLLGRPLKPAEVREVIDIARRIAALRLLEPALDGSCERAKAETWMSPTRSQ
ncbi:MAG: N-6 DNA methylase [Armatimonadetes bacterium]|nr:N-6 DNA methylase [Armatimonadota bacterium]